MNKIAVLLAKATEKVFFRHDRVHDSEISQMAPVQEACTIWAFPTKCYVYAKGVRGSSARTPFLFCCTERQEYRLAISPLPERSGQQSPQAPGQTIWNESEDGADIL